MPDPPHLPYLRPTPEQQLIAISELSSYEREQLALYALSLEDPAELEELRAYIANLRRSIVLYALEDPFASTDEIYSMIVQGEFSGDDPPPPDLVPDWNWLYIFLQIVRGPEWGEFDPTVDRVGRGTGRIPSDEEIAQWAYEAERALTAWMPHDDPSVAPGPVGFQRIRAADKCAVAQGSRDCVEDTVLAIRQADSYLFLTSIDEQSLSDPTILFDEQNLQGAPTAAIRDENVNVLYKTDLPNTEVVIFLYDNESRYENLQRGFGYYDVLPGIGIPLATGESRVVPLTSDAFGVPDTELQEEDRAAELTFEEKLLTSPVYALIRPDLAEQILEESRARRLDARVAVRNMVRYSHGTCSFSRPFADELSDIPPRVDEEVDREYSETALDLEDPWVFLVSGLVGGPPYLLYKSGLDTPGQFDSTLEDLAVKVTTYLRNSGDSRARGGIAISVYGIATGSDFSDFLPGYPAGVSDHEVSTRIWVDLGLDSGGMLKWEIDYSVDVRGINCGEPEFQVSLTPIYFKACGEGVAEKIEDSVRDDLAPKLAKGGVLDRALSPIRACQILPLPGDDSAAQECSRLSDCAPVRDTLITLAQRGAQILDVEPNVLRQVLDILRDNRNFRCAPYNCEEELEGIQLPDDPNQPICQIILRAARSNVYPDEFELVWFDGDPRWPDQVTTGYAMFLALTGLEDIARLAGQPIDALSELCTRRRALMTTVRRFPVLGL